MSFDDGGAYALLGPSGCGKTTMLNIMSGLLVPSQGTVHFDGQDVTRASPQQRNIAQVFQFPVIYDTMTVAQNLAFPLRNRQGARGPDPPARAARSPRCWSCPASSTSAPPASRPTPSRRSRSAAAWCGADVAAVLFDEPLTVIDPHLKWQLRRKLKQIHHELKLTLIYVTHDQVEALTFADQVVVMTRGRAVQVGSADAAVRAPAAHLRRPLHRLAGHELPAGAGGRRPAAGGRPQPGRWPGALPEGELELGVRPEYVALADPRCARCAAGGGGAGAGRRHPLDADGARRRTPAQGPAGRRRRLPAAGGEVWLQVLGEHTCFYRDEVLV